MKMRTEEIKTSLQGKGARARLDVSSLRRDFPILSEKVNGNPLVYLDNAATSQKPTAVLDSLESYYRHDNSNIHRGVHTLSERATKAYEAARGKVKDFLNARSLEEVIFVRGTTEAINLVAHSYGAKFLKAGDEILLSAMEHHSNIVPWQMIAEHTGAKIRVIPMDDHGELMLEEFKKLLSPRTKILALVHVSNALGTINPVAEMTRMAHDVGAVVLLDGAQAVPHIAVDVQALGCDFYAFSSHKIYGPTGVGVLWGRKELLEHMPPYQGGGDMIRHVTFGRTIYNALPYKFEAGTPHIAGGIALGAALDYVSLVGLDAIAAHEADLLAYATQAVSEVPGVRLIGTAKAKAGVLSFMLEGIHPHDIGTILDHSGIAIRTGHHCAQPVMDRFGVPATARASFALYNTREEIDALVKGLYKVIEVFK
jgi:cysteine desulfurase / selenocysteine lyase